MANLKRAPANLGAVSSSLQSSVEILVRQAESLKADIRVLTVTKNALQDQLSLSRSHYLTYADLCLLKQETVKSFWESQSPVLEESIEEYCAISAEIRKIRAELISAEFQTESSVCESPSVFDPADFPMTLPRLERSEFGVRERDSGAILRWAEELRAESDSFETALNAASSVWEMGAAESLAELARVQGRRESAPLGELRVEIAVLEDSFVMERERCSALELEVTRLRTKKMALALGFDKQRVELRAWVRVQTGRMRTELSGLDSERRRLIAVVNALRDKEALETDIAELGATFEDLRHEIATKAIGFREQVKRMNHRLADLSMEIAALSVRK
jgi:hypothetical protein